MLFAIHKGNVEAYIGGQREVLHLVSDAERVAQTSDLACCFTDGHADMGFSEFFEDLKELDKQIDWSVMKAQYWSDSVDIGK